MTLFYNSRVWALITAGVLFGAWVSLHTPHAPASDEIARAEQRYALAMQNVAREHRRADSLALALDTAQAHTTRTVTVFRHVYDTLTTALGHAVPVDTAHPVTRVLVGLGQPPVDTVVTLGDMREALAAGRAAVDSAEAVRGLLTARVAVLTALIATQDTALAHADTLITALRGAVRQRECRILALPCPSRLTTLAATALAVLVWRR